MTGPWTITVPEAGSNKVLNPSGELAGNFAAYNGSTVTRDATHARFGFQSYKIVPGAINRGMDVTMAALANAIHYATLYVWGMANPLTLQISFDLAVTWNTVSIIGGSTAGWVRVGFAIPAAQANASVTFRIRNTANETWWADAFQAEQNSYFTTYIDGDLGPLYRWSGLRAGSVSTRSAQDRGGGRERNLLDDYGIKVRQNLGAGLPPLATNTLPQSLLPGATFQSSKVLPRSVTFLTDLHSTNQAATGLHQQRETLINLVKSGVVQGNQAFILGYTVANSGKKLYAQFRYTGGLELGKVDAGPTYIEQDSKVPLQLLAVDPYWYEDSVDTTSLTISTAVASENLPFAMLSGLWTKLGSVNLAGGSALVESMAFDSARNRIYFAGSFTTINSVTCNGICYWDGNNFIAMDAGIGPLHTEDVLTVTVAPNGDVWIGGNFTTVGSGAAATKGLARWNLASSSWTAFNVTTTTFIEIDQVAVDKNNNLYIAGIFTGWNGVAGEDYVAKFTGSWVKLGTTPFSGSETPTPRGRGSDFDQSSNWYIGSLTNGGAAAAHLFKWDGTAWTTALATDARSASSVQAVYFAPDGTFYLSGNFGTLGGVTAAAIAQWNGSTVVPLGSGLNSNATSLARLSNGLLVAAGNFTSAGGNSNIKALAYWNGYSWLPTDINLGAGTSAYLAAALSNSDFWLAGWAPLAFSVAAQTTVNNSGSAPVFPVITFTPTTTAAAQTTLVWLENQSAGYRLYLSLVGNAGETITIDLRSGRKVVSSDWRGVIQDQPISGSDLAAWQLLAGNNTIAALATGTLTGAAVLINSQPAHLSVDTVA